MLKKQSKKTKGYISRLVYSILVHDAQSRDDWMLVVKEIHDREMAIYAIPNERYYDSVFSYKLSNPQTICRVWRKVQEHNVELRGAEWSERQKMAGEISSIISSSQMNLF